MRSGATEVIFGEVSSLSLWQRSSESVIPVDGAPGLTEGGNVIGQLDLLSILRLDQLDDLLVFFVEISQHLSMFGLHTFGLDSGFGLQALK